MCKFYILDLECMALTPPLTDFHGFPRVAERARRVPRIYFRCKRVTHRPELSRFRAPKNIPPPLRLSSITPYASYEQEEKEEDFPSLRESRCSTEHEISVHTKRSPLPRTPVRRGARLSMARSRR